MREIQMVDLKAQYEKISAEVDNAVKSVIESTAFIKGPEVKKLEEELQNYLGARHVITCGNGTDALQIATSYPLLALLYIEYNNWIIATADTKSTIKPIVVAEISSAFFIRDYLLFERLILAC